MPRETLRAQGNLRPGRGGDAGVQDAQYADADYHDEGEAEPIDHDPQGLDLASQVAHRARSILPAPRGVKPRKAPPKRAIGEPNQRSTARPDPRDPQLLGAALNRVMDERGWTREVNLRTVLAKWASVVGPDVADHSQPEAYADGVLTIRAESTTWASALRQLAPRLVAQLNEHLGDGTVTRVVVNGPTAPSWKHGPRAVRDGRGPRDTYG